MFDSYREIQNLLVDYAEALRDGCLLTFLKSLRHFEAKHVISLPNFWRAAETARALNSAGFADKVIPPNMDLFISRVDAKIASRSKKGRGLSLHKHRSRARA